MLHRGAPMVISILNDLLLFSCLAAERLKVQRRITKLRYLPHGT